MKRAVLVILGACFALGGASFAYLFLGSAPAPPEISWGVNFSQKHAEHLGLDWKEAYSALLEDLGARRVKLALSWDMLEKEPGVFDFHDLDWQMDMARARGAKVILAVGMKTPRWPECHIPLWAKELSEKGRQEAILRMLSAVVVHVADNESVAGWQVENEPLFPFGECPKTDARFLQKEIALVQSIDVSRPVFTSDSGELSLWIRAAKIGDKVAVTMYKRAWFDFLKRYVEYPFPPVFYYRKAELIRLFFGKEVFVGELQAEPWTPVFVSMASAEEQSITMNPEKFQEVIDFAGRTGLSEFYLWGSEWWYWLKTTRGDSAMWDRARRLF
ncbi:MAG: beta-galactosidase [Candidatus Wildermuthbacteria bacterium]|nr:beta-galactosidase [Candidatus Wildermuthbacteria bacterium]